MLSLDPMFACSGWADGLASLLTSPWLPGQMLSCSPILAAAAWTWRQRAFQRFARAVFHTLYRIRVVGMENWPREGGAVLVSNHTTWLDGQLLLIMAPRRTRVIAWSANFTNPFRRWLAWAVDVILITGGPKSILRGLQTANQAVRDGEVVGIFPEGGLSRTGQIQSFKPGVMRIVKGTGAPVVPVYIDQTWGSIFSCAGGSTIWKLPKSIRRPITITIGQPIPEPESIHVIRQALQSLGADAVANRQPPFVAPARKFVRSCKKRRFRLKAADSAGTEVSGAATLMRALILRRLLRKHVLGTDEQNVGILIPPSFAGLAANVALALDRRVAVNLNYTVSNEIMNVCIQRARLQHVLTSRRVMDKFDFRLDCEVVYLEDLREQLTWQDKLAGLAGAWLIPGRWLEARLGLVDCREDDVLTIIFTSGSTGVPKGVMLTNRNIATNVEAIDQVVKLKPSDTLIGILPFFHSFGYTVTLWGVAALNIAGVYHFSPLEAMQVGKLCEKYGVTILLSTPTFLRSYLRKCTPQQFAQLDVVVAGAEKLPSDLCDAFEKKFGVRPVEGYGTTELSPLVAVNVPPSRRGDNYMVDCKEGTVGRPIPNVAARVTDFDSGDELGVNQEGNLWIKGPNTMLGYLDQPEKTAEVMQDGWYNTGDVALIDEDGFIRITGRISRFSKIGGEMVPHVVIEDTLGSLLDEDEQGELRFAVTAVPHAKKGEQLIVLHTKVRKTPGDYCRGLAKAGLPNLYIPAERCFYEVDELPLLGTGKLDLRAMKSKALELAGD
jgi:acyl-[acyl-carrier-protein]-phospholipid O-acyltransferase/long-chain-fatty-acid--[acyl-carrier-protein] ligase